MCVSCDKTCDGINFLHHETDWQSVMLCDKKIDIRKVLEIKKTERSIILQKRVHIRLDGSTKAFYRANEIHF